MAMEQLNILNDLVGRLSEGKAKTLSDIIVSEEQDNQIGNMFSWFDYLKIMGLATIGFVLFLTCIRIFVACKFFRRKQFNIEQRQKRRKSSPRGIELQEMNPTLSDLIVNVDGKNRRIVSRKFTAKKFHPIISNPRPKPTIVPNNIILAETSDTASALGTPKLSPIKEIKEEKIKIDSTEAEAIYNSTTDINEPKEEETELKPMEKVEMIDTTPQCSGSHTRCRYVVGHGLLWEDLCKCTP